MLQILIVYETQIFSNICCMHTVNMWEIFRSLSQKMLMI